MIPFPFDLADMLALAIIGVILLAVVVGIISMWCSERRQALRDEHASSWTDRF